MRKPVNVLQEFNIFLQPIWSFSMNLVLRLRLLLAPLSTLLSLPEKDLKFHYSSGSTYSDRVQVYVGSKRVYSYDWITGVGAYKGSDLGKLHALWEKSLNEEIADHTFDCILSSPEGAVHCVFAREYLQDDKPDQVLVYLEWKRRHTYMWVDGEKADPDSSLGKLHAYCKDLSRDAETPELSMSMFANAEDFQKALARSEPQPSALTRFQANGVTDDLSPLSRLRYFCSLAMNGQDWIDVEPFFDAVESRAAQQNATNQQTAPGIPSLATPEKPIKWAEEEIARGYLGIRWVSREGVAGRPTADDVHEYLATSPMCTDSARPVVNTDVRTILLEVVPGPDGIGQEVYAKSVEDVTRLLTELGEKAEELESIRTSRASLTAEEQGKRGAAIQALHDIGYTYECGAWYPPSPR